jgi:hypothetical protein
VATSGERRPCNCRCYEISRALDILSRGRSAPRGEELLELRRALFRQHAAKYVDTVIEFRQREDIYNAAGCARAQIPSSKNKALDAGMHYGGCTHDARLERYVEGGSVQAIVPELTACGAQRQDLGVSCRIMQLDGAIDTLGNDCITAHEDRADGDLGVRPRLGSKLEGSMHEVYIGARRGAA